MRSLMEEGGSYEVPAVVVSAGLQWRQGKDDSGRECLWHRRGSVMPGGVVVERWEDGGTEFGRT